VSSHGPNKTPGNKDGDSEWAYYSIDRNTAKRLSIPDLCIQCCKLPGSRLSPPPPSSFCMPNPSAVWHLCFPSPRTPAHGPVRNFRFSQSCCRMIHILIIPDSPSLTSGSTHLAGGKATSYHRTSRFDGFCRQRQATKNP